MRPACSETHGTFSFIKSDSSPDLTQKSYPGPKVQIKMPNSADIPNFTRPDPQRNTNATGTGPTERAGFDMELSDAALSKFKEISIA